MTTEKIIMIVAFVIFMYSFLATDYLSNEIRPLKNKKNSGILMSVRVCIILLYFIIAFCIRIIRNSIGG